MRPEAAFGEEDHILLPKRRQRLEAAIQRSIIGALRWHGILAVHTANEGKRSVRAGRQAKADGLRPGWPDLSAYSLDGDHGLMEVKSDTGRLSEAQKSCHAELQRRGVKVAVVRSIDDALAAVKAWGWVR